MTGRTTVTLLVVAAGLGAYYFLGEVKGGEARKEAKDKAELLFPFADSLITEFRSVRGVDTLVVRRSGSEWELVRPISSPADEGNVNSAVSSIVTTRREETLDGTIDPAQYGLRPPRMALTVTGPGNSAKTIYLGEYNPTQSFSYAMWPDSNKVMLVSASARRALDKEASEFRDHTVMTTQIAEVQRVIIRQGEAPQDLVLVQAGSRWRETSPGSFRADKVTVETLLGTLGSARILEFVNDNPSPGDIVTYGLDKPALSLRVESGKDAAAKVLLLGKEDEARKAWYAKREGRPTVFLLSDDNLVKSLQKLPSEYRSPNVVEFEQQDVKRIAFASADSTWTIEKDTIKDDKEGPGYAWKRKENGVRFDVNKVNDLLWEVKRLRWAEVVSENAGADVASYGLAKPARSITLYGDGDKEIARLRLGGDRPGKDEIFAMNGTEPVLYSVAKSAAASIPATLADYTEVKQTAASDAGNPNPGTGKKTRGQ